MNREEILQMIEEHLSIEIRTTHTPCSDLVVEVELLLDGKHISSEILPIDYDGHIRI